MNATLTDNPYKILGLDRAASAEQIEDAWKAAVRRHHPDRGTDAADIARRTRRTAQLNSAHDILDDPVERAELDRALARAEAGAQSGGTARPSASARSESPRPTDRTGAGRPAAAEAARPQAARPVRPAYPPAFVAYMSARYPSFETELRAGADYGPQYAEWQRVGQPDPASTTGRERTALWDQLLTIVGGTAAVLAIPLLMGLDGLLVAGLIGLVLVAGLVAQPVLVGRWSATPACDLATWLLHLPLLAARLARRLGRQRLGSPR